MATTNGNLIFSCSSQAMVLLSIITGCELPTERQPAARENQDFGRNHKDKDRIYYVGRPRARVYYY